MQRRAAVLAAACQPASSQQSAPAFLLSPPRPLSNPCARGAARSPAPACPPAPHNKRRQPTTLRTLRAAPPHPKRAAPTAAPTPTPTTRAQLVPAGRARRRPGLSSAHTRRSAHIRPRPTALKPQQQDHDAAVCRLPGDRQAGRRVWRGRRVSGLAAHCWALPPGPLPPPPPACFPLPTCLPPGRQPAHLPAAANSPPQAQSNPPAPARRHSARSPGPLPPLPVLPPIQLAPLFFLPSPHAY